MELYNTTSYKAAQLFTEEYSTSFSASCRLFPLTIRKYIYAIYGLVRVADEIVDTYKGDNVLTQLDALEAEVRNSRQRQYSANPLVQAFILTAEQYDINDELVAPFFESMRMDIGEAYEPSRYEEYIYGSAEVVGLMCLKVFVQGDAARFEALKPGARALGSAYQKVNFLRDIKADHEIGRMYFPGVAYDSFDDDAKRNIEINIAKDYEVARDYINKLPKSARLAVALSYEYYQALLEKIKAVSAKDLQQHRIRVPDSKKLQLLVSTKLRRLGGER